MLQYYKIDDSHYWDIQSACFIASVSTDADWTYPMTDKWESRDEDGLRKCLRYFGQPLGELKEDADYAAEAREKRNALIAETDYMAMPDYPLDDEKKAVILAYRQALRDVPEQAGFPRQIDWPTKP